MISDGLPAEGIVAAFQFAELRHVRWQLGNQATSTGPFVEGGVSGHGAKPTSAHVRCYVGFGGEADPLCSRGAFPNLTHVRHRRVKCQIRRLWIPVTRRTVRSGK